MSNLPTAVAIGALLLAAEPLTAQPVPSWNRKTEGVSVLPAPVAGSFFDITYFASITASDLTGPIDLSTELEIQVNGTPVHTETHSITANPPTAGDCSGLPCGDEPCYCTPPPVVCECGPVVISSVATVPATAGDEIIVLLRPAPGAVPETDQSDDQHTLPFPGEPVFWNRRIASVEIVPAPVEALPDSFFDIIIDICDQARYQGNTNLTASLELRIDGVEYGSQPVSFGDLNWSYCDASCTGPCVNDGAGPVGSCQENPQDPGDCACELDPVQFGFLAVPLDPGDEIVVILRPAPGALPELPGFGDDDEQTRPVCPWDCGDGDFVVGVVDFLELLAQWGQPGASCDFDGGGVGITDFLKMLGQWGPCFPM
jgi:hypothetical protein